MSRINHSVFSLGLLIWGTLLTAAPTSQALEPFAGFEEIPWGASQEDIRAKEKRHLKSDGDVNPKLVDFDKEAALVGMKLAPPAKVLVYEGYKGEKVLYFMVANELTGVIHRPSGPLMFRPGKILSKLKKQYGDTPKDTKGLEYPDSYGRFDPVIEYSLTYDWESPKGRVRATTRVWQPLDIRQVFSVMYSSTAMNQKAEQRIESIERAREEAAASPEAASP